MHLIRKSRLAFAFLLASAIPSLATKIIVGQDEPNPDKAAIVKMAASYVDAFNKRDAGLVAQHWAENGEFVDGNGDTVVGRDKIKRAMEEQFQSMKADHVLSVTIHRISFVTKNVAIEVGVADVSGSQTEYTAVHKKEGDSWKLHSIRESVVSDSSALKENKLVELEWMVGEWVDESDEAVVRSSCRWSKNNHFLINNFKVETPGTDPMQGTQVIAYDAAKGKVRSWTFDSRGRIAEGTWTRKGDQWVVRSKSVTSDGLSASGTNILTVKNNNEYNWKSINRKIDGEKLPDIDPVNVVRLKEEN